MKELISQGEWAAMGKQIDDDTSTLDLIFRPGEAAEAEAKAALRKIGEDIRRAWLEDSGGGNATVYNARPPIYMARRNGVVEYEKLLPFSELADDYDQATFDKLLDKAKVKTKQTDDQRVQQSSKDALINRLEKRKTLLIKQCDEERKKSAALEAEVERYKMDYLKQLATTEELRGELRKRIKDRD